MNVEQIFALGVKMGIAADPRGAKGVQKYLKKINKQYDDLKPSEKEYYDTDKLTNPYPDSRIHVDDGKTQVKRVMAGIDITPADVLLASQLDERGKHVDLIINHHPLGKAMATIHEVMEMTVEMYEAMGVPIHSLEKSIEERAVEVGKHFHPMNQYQTVNMAQILGVNLMNTHTITDNLVDNFVQKFLQKEKPETIAELLETLLKIPEYNQAKRLGFGPMLYSGKPSYRVGKYLLGMTGGTEPSAKLYEHFSKAGFSTVITMHMVSSVLEKLGPLDMNVVISGHISSDSIGMNLFLDELERQGVEIVPYGGLVRVSRVKGKK